MRASSASGTKTWPLPRGLDPLPPVKGLRHQSWGGRNESVPRPRAEGKGRYPHLAAVAVDQLSALTKVRGTARRAAGHRPCTESQAIRRRECCPDRLNFELTHQGENNISKFFGGRGSRRNIDSELRVLILVRVTAYCTGYCVRLCILFARSHAQAKNPQALNADST